MKKSRTDKLLLVLSIVAYAVMSGSFLLMPIERLQMISGILFWSGLLCGSTMQLLLRLRFSAFFRRTRQTERKTQKPVCGCFSFGSNSIALVADVCLAGCLVATVLSFAFTNGSGYLCYAGIGATVFAFCLHCIFNGRIYFHINNVPRLRYKPEQQGNSNKEKERE